MEAERNHWLKRPDVKVAKLPSKRVTGGLVQQAREELLKRFGITMAFYEQHMALISTNTSTETKLSMTYPGLETEYVYINSTMRVRKSGMVEGAAIGLPTGSGFQLSEETEHLSTRRSIFFWSVLTSIRTDGDLLDSPTVHVPCTPPSSHSMTRIISPNKFFSRISTRRDSTESDSRPQSRNKKRRSP